MTVSSSDLRIDSLDVIARIEELREELANLNTYNDGDSDQQAELDALEELAEQGREFDDWEYGIQLIHEDDFEEFAEELVTDLGYLDPVPDWIKYHIDWAGVADELHADYSSVEFEGQTYYIR